MTTAILLSTSFLKLANDSYIWLVFITIVTATCFFNEYLLTLYLKEKPLDTYKKAYLFFIPLQITFNLTLFFLFLWLFK